MSKVHLQTDSFYSDASCGLINTIVTSFWEKVTCKNCMKTNEYKQIKKQQLNKEAQEIMASHGKDERWNKEERTCDNCRFAESICSNTSVPLEFPDNIEEIAVGNDVCNQWTPKLKANLSGQRFDDTAIGKRVADAVNKKIIEEPPKCGNKLIERSDIDSLYKIEDIEITLKVKQYENKNIEFVQALNELVEMYGHHLINSDIDMALDYIKNIDRS